MLIKVTGIEVGSTSSTGEARKPVIQSRHELHINPDRVVFVRMPTDTETMARVRVDNFETWVSAEDARLIIDQSNKTPAPAAAPAPKNASTTITAMTRDITKSGGVMWRCATEKGFMVNVFAHDDPLKDTFALFVAAGYAGPMSAMRHGDTINWTVSPVAVELVQNGAFWNVVTVCDRPEGAMPDADQPEGDGDDGR